MPSLAGFFQLPPSILDIKSEIEPPSEYEGYTYKFTDTITGKFYIGIHKGMVDGMYWNSSTCKEMHEMLSSGEKRLVIDILAYGSYKDMQRKERLLLENDGPKTNPLCLNKSVGSAKLPINQDGINNLAGNINKGTWRAKNMPITDLMVIRNRDDAFQVRGQEDGEHVDEICQRITDAAGNTDKCNPVVIYASRKNGKDVIGDGNHTVLAVHKYAEREHSRTGRDPKTITVPVSIVPKNEHENFTDIELMAVGNLLNARAEVLKKGATVEDGVKFLVARYMEDGTDPKDLSNSAILKSMRFSNKQMTYIRKLAEREIKDSKGLTGGEVWISYKDIDRDLLNKNVYKNTNEDTLCIALPSAAFKWDHVFNKLYTESEVNKDGARVSKKKNFKVVLYHSRPSDQEKWNKIIKKEVTDKLECLCSFFGTSSSILELPTTRKNTISSK